MPAPKPPWLPNGSTVGQERTRAVALNVPALRDEHAELFSAHLNMLARVEDAATGSRRHTWALNVKRIRRLGRAMAVAIDTGSMADRLKARDEWDKPRRDLPAMFNNAGQELANIGRWSKSVLVDEHVELWVAFKNSRAKKDAVQAEGDPLVWTATIRQARNLANAMRDAIDTGDMNDRLLARGEWMDHAIDARDDA